MPEEPTTPENFSPLASLAVKNSLYECNMSHTRVSPKKHTFSYKVFMFAIDLDHFPKIPLLSKNRFNLFSIDNRDHINTDPQKSTRQNLTTFLAEDGIEIPTDARITLLTFPRILGYSFNPVSFYYIHSHNGSPLTAVAEVTNTYREMKLYPLGTPDTEGKFNHTTPKNFYVSPFSDPNDTFHFRLHQPATDWTVHIDNLTTGKPTLLSSIRSQRKPLTTPRLAWFALKYPLLSLLIIFRIHLHALLLFLKKIPHFPKSTPITERGL
ncbi:MAG: DUF1365 domain-containing protein [Akkermansiaceae bacterium]|nr:DUF1365 domain-containing protein [Akkermansiaceae bacterium]MDP4897902.1 DUF1365 domain-containing protein [Akkermansiaceae bacterium]